MADDLTRLRPGDLAPDFTLRDAEGREHSLRDYRGRRVVVYFYPAASTPGCTAQACDFRDALDDFAAAGIDVLAISPDPPEAIRRFRDAERLPFPLLSDPDHRVLEAYGAWGEKTLYGKHSVGVLRSTFVVGPDGRIESAYYDVRARGHVTRLRSDLAI